jgi:hypothetical protein
MEKVIENLDKTEAIQEKIIDMSVLGNAHSKISDEINLEFGTNLNKQNIQKFLLRAKRKIFNYAVQDENYKEKLAKTYFDSVEQIKELNSKLWKLFYDLENHPQKSKKTFFCSDCGKRNKVEVESYNALLKTSNEIMNSIKHVDKVLQRTGGNPLKIEMNVVDMTQKITNIIPELFDEAKRRGDIRILNKKKFRKFH